MPLRPPLFQINAKNYFLTYPQCSLSKEEVLQQIINLETPVNKKYIKVAKELHEDGQPHIHVLLQFEGKFNYKNNRFFDLVSPTRSAHFHPTIQGAKSSSDVKSYVEKDGDTTEWGQFQIDARSARGGSQTANESSAKALNASAAKALNASSVEEALEILKQEQPKDYFLHHRIIRSNLERIFTPPTPPTQTFQSEWDPQSFIINGDIEQWLREVFEDPAARPVINNGSDTPVSLIIEGPSRIGKTEWARSLGAHNYISGHLDFNIKKFSNNVSYNVIDNVAPSYLKLKHWKALIGAKRDWQANTYGKPVQIKGGITSIVLCNPGKGSSYKSFLEKKKNKSLNDWTLKNAYFTFINTPMYQNTLPHQQESHQETQN